MSNISNNNYHELLHSVNLIIQDNDEQDEPQESDIIIVPDTPPISHASSVDPATDHRTNYS